MGTIQYTDLGPLFRPRSLAVVGASEKPGPGSMALTNLSLIGFRGPVYAVNPRYREVHEYACFPRLANLPEPPDCVAIAVPSALAPGVLKEAIECGARSAIVYGSGFAETGDAGRVLQEELHRIAFEHRVPVCGPNCVGLINLQSGFAAFSAPLPIPLPKGRVGAIVQSGSMCIGLLNSGRGVGFSYVISSGNEAVTECADYIHFLVSDPSTDVIVAFVEGFRDIHKLADVADLAVERKKPIIVVKVGRSDLSRRAVLAHTGALAGSDAVHDAFFHQHGIIRVRDIDEMLEGCKIFLKTTLPLGNGVGVITVSGGQVGLVADLAQDEGLTFPELSSEAKEDLKQILPPFSNIGNPLDAWGIGDLEHAYPRCLERIAQEHSISAIAVCQDAPPGLSRAQADTYQNVARASVQVARTCHKPLVFFSNISGGFEPSIQSILDEGGIPMLQGTRESLRALSALIRYAQFLRERRQPSQPPSIELCPDLKTLLSRSTLTEHESKKLLTAFGIRVTRERSAASLDEARRAAQEIGYPLVIKVDSPDILHKTEASAVRVGIENEIELARAYEQVLNGARAYRSDANIRGVLVQEMVDTRRAVELIAGLAFDPQFGHSVVFGIGGVLVEVYRDLAIRLVPLDEAEAHAMLREIKGRTILDGVRGMPKVDLDAIVKVLLSLSTMAVCLGERIANVDINPLFAFPSGQGVIAADARIICRGDG